MRYRPHFVAAVLAASFLVACALGRGREEGRFPTSQELEELRQVPPPESPFPTEALDVSSWELGEPLADRLGATPRFPSTAWDELLAEAVERRQGLALATEEMDCAAGKGEGVVENEIISYLEMCQREGASLQKGMNFLPSRFHAVVLMSVRPGAPCADRIEDNGRTLVY